MLTCPATLSLWNDFAPGRLDEYEIWHTREHVPERLSIEGILGARRYVRGDGPLPSFFTLYELASIDVLAAPAYLSLLKTPSRWSQTMRPDFRNFLRIGQEVTASAGGGLGGALMATVFPEGDPIEARAIAAFTETVLEVAAVTAIHLLTRDASVAPVPFAVESAGEAPPDHGTLLVEGTTREALMAAIPEIDAALGAAGLGRGRLDWSSYEFAYDLRARDLGQIHTLDGLPDRSI